MKRQEFSKRQQREIWRRSKGKCAECGRKIRFRSGHGAASSVGDHIRPQWGGGANTVKNGQRLCETCNREKTDREKEMRDKADRVAKKHQGRWVSKHRPIDGSRRSRWGKTFDGEAYRR